MNEEPSKTYAVFIPGYIDNRSDLTTREKYIFGIVNGLAIKEGYCYASNAYLARRMKCGEQTVSRAISKIKKMGLWSVEIGIHESEDGENSLGTRRTITPFLLGEMTRGVVTSDYGGVVTSDYHSIKVNSNKKNNKKVFNSGKVEVSVKGIDNRDENQSVSQLFAFYLDAHGYKGNVKPRLTPARISKFKTRLKTFSPDEIKQAIRNFMADTWKRERLGIDYIIRNDENIDSLLNANPLPKPKGNYLTDEEILARTV